MRKGRARGIGGVGEGEGNSGRFADAFILRLDHTPFSVIVLVRIYCTTRFTVPAD